MAQQPNLFTPNPRDPTPGTPPGRPRPAPQEEVSSRGMVWVARVEAAIRILVNLYLGLLVMVLPWLPFWTQNNLFTYDPALAALAGNGFVRGLVSGLGILNVLSAVIDGRRSMHL